MQKGADRVHLFFPGSGEPAVVDVAQEWRECRQSFPGLVCQRQGDGATVLRIAGFVDPATGLKFANDRRDLCTETRKWSATVRF